jgi:hypothetical protein
MTKHAGVVVTLYTLMNEVYHGFTQSLHTNASIVLWICSSSYLMHLITPTVETSPINILKIIITEGISNV